MKSLPKAEPAFQCPHIGCAGFFMPKFYAMLQLRLGRGKACGDASVMVACGDKRRGRNLKWKTHYADQVKCGARNDIKVVGQYGETETRCIVRC